VKRKRLERAARLAAGLAVDVDARLPCTVPPGELLAAVLPLAVRLERLERKAAKGRRQARRYRRAVRQARREAGQLLASQDGALVTVPALLRTVPLDPGSWRVGLVPGAPAEDFATESEAA
jgi:hypothetical protein